MELPKKISGEIIAFAAQHFTQKLDFDVLWFRRRKSVQNLGRKKRKKKKEINFIATENGLVGMKGYLEKYNHMKYFLPYLSRF